MRLHRDGRSCRMVFSKSKLYARLCRKHSLCLNQQQYFNQVMNTDKPPFIILPTKVSISPSCTSEVPCWACSSYRAVYSSLHYLHLSLHVHFRHIGEAATFITLYNRGPFFTHNVTLQCLNISQHMHLPYVVRCCLACLCPTVLNEYTVKKKVQIDLFTETIHHPPHTPIQARARARAHTYIYTSL